MEEVERCNSEHRSYSCVVNRFTYMTPAERERYLGLRNDSTTTMQRYKIRVTRDVDDLC